MNANIFVNFICFYFKYCIYIGELAQVLKHADITPVHKKKEKSEKTNDRYVIIFPNLSKIYEKLIYNQLYDYYDYDYDTILFPSQYGFRKRYSSQNCLLAMLENVEKSADNENKFGASLTGLAKPFDCIDHKLLIAKFFWYGVSPSALNLIHS